MSAVPADLITPRKAARILGCHISSIYRWTLRGKLRAWRRAGERYLLSEQEVRALIVPVEVEETPVDEEAAARQAMERLKTTGYRF